MRYGLDLMRAANSCGGAWFHGGDIPGCKTRNAVMDDGRRAVDQHGPDVPGDRTRGELGRPDELTDHALCG